MANFITKSFTHTYAGKELIQELFYTPQEGSQNVFANYRVLPNVKTKINMYLPGTLNDIVREYTTCGFSATGSAINVTDKVLDVEKLKVNLEQCVDTFFDTIFEETMGAGIDIDNAQGTIIEEIARTKVVDGIRDDLGKIAWFAQDGAASASYNMFDGWIQLFVDDSSSLGQYVDMDTIAGVETTGVLDTDGALALLRNMYENQSKELRQIPARDKKFYVTATVIDNLMTTYEDTQSGTGLLRLIDGGNMAFRGIEVVEVTGWDTQLDDANNPQASLIGDNLVIYTSPSNLVIGTDVSAPENELKFRFNDDDDELLKIISKFRMGVQYVHPVLVSMAY